MATLQEADRTAARGQWTIKSKLLDPETLNAVRLAATKAGLALGDWVAIRLREIALAELGHPVEKPSPPPPPARIEDVRDALMAAVEERLAPLAALAERLAAPPIEPAPAQDPHRAGGGGTDHEARMARVARRRRR